MAKQIDYRLLVKIVTNTTLTVSTILNEPRHCTPVDVLSASQTIQFQPESEGIADHLQRFAEFIVRDFFVVAHRTGLYNRQRLLWQATGRVAEIKLTRALVAKTFAQTFENPLTSFNKVNAPYVDYSFRDGRGNLLIWASFLDQPEPKEKFKSEKSYAKAIEHFLVMAIERAHLVKKRETNLQGIFIGLPDPVPNMVLNYMTKVTEATDPVRRYEAILQPPMSIHCNIIGTAFGANDVAELSMHVVYPPLKALQVANGKGA